MKAKGGFVTEDNMALLADFYEYTMGMADFTLDANDTIVENYFVRKIPQGEYMIFAGLEQLVHFIENFKIPEEDIEWLRQKKGHLLSDEYLSYLRNFEFHVDVWSVPEGTPVFANEPLINVKGPSIEVQLLESYLLCVVNSQTLMATKASRCVESAQGRAVLDFGLRRQHGRDPTTQRATYIGGCVGSSNLLAERLFDVPSSGTMAHKFVQQRDTELECFVDYATVFPDHTILLIDTYGTIPGARNAIKVAKVMEAQGHKLVGVRLDSGDLVELSKQVRQMLDSAGLEYVKIAASNDLDEYTIEDLLSQGAKIDLFGVGTRLATGAVYNPRTGEGGPPALPGVYKIIQLENEDGVVDKIKTSSDPEKTIWPREKQVWRVYEKGQYVKDVVTGVDEPGPEDAVPLLEKVVENGRAVYDDFDAHIMRQRRFDELAKLPEQYKALDRAARYPVEFSEQLQTARRQLIEKLSEA